MASQTRPRRDPSRYQKNYSLEPPLATKPKKKKQQEQQEQQEQPTAQPLPPRPTPFMPTGPNYLLALPPELRNHIYDHLLVSPTPVGVDGLLEPGIIATCRQIRTETLPIFYGANAFVGAAPSTLGAWLGRIGREKGKLVKWLSVETAGPSS